MPEDHFAKIRRLLDELVDAALAHRDPRDDHDSRKADKIDAVIKGVVDAKAALTDGASCDACGVPAIFELPISIGITPPGGLVLGMGPLGLDDMLAAVDMLGDETVRAALAVRISSALLSYQARKN